MLEARINSKQEVMTRFLTNVLAKKGAISIYSRQMSFIYQAGILHLITERVGGTESYSRKCVRLLMEISEPPISELSTDLLPCQNPRKLQKLGNVCRSTCVIHHLQRVESAYKS